MKQSPYTWNDVFRACFPDKSSFENSRKKLEMLFPGVSNEALTFKPGTNPKTEFQKLVSMIRKGMVLASQSPEFCEQMIEHTMQASANYAAKN